MSDKKDKNKGQDITDIVFDNIKEEDNNLPKWWLLLFYACIAWGAFYVGYYEFGPGLQPHEMLALEMEQHQKEKEAVEVADNAITEKVDYIALSKISENIAHGKDVFVAKCAACHGQRGEGLVGPNLTDDQWVHGSSIEQIEHVIEKGVIEKGMLAWKGILKKDDYNDVIAFVWSIKNTNIPGKAPEGKKES